MEQSPAGKLAKYNKIDSQIITRTSYYLVFLKCSNDDVIIQKRGSNYSQFSPILSDLNDFKSEKIFWNQWNRETFLVNTKYLNTKPYYGNSCYIGYSKYSIQCILYQCITVNNQKYFWLNRLNMSLVVITGYDGNGVKSNKGKVHLLQVVITVYTV